MREVYENYFGFKNKPFNVTPDPDFLYYSDQHKEALAHMMYGVQERKGFVLVTGRVGTGKTTVCRAFLKELDESVKTALVLNSTMNFNELLLTIAEDLGIKLPENPTKKEVIDLLQEFVIDQYERGNNVCLVIDEAQNLDYDVLENLRLLSNFETDKEKLFQIVLVGQPELNSLLGEKELRQLKQRIAVRSHLSNLDREETREYVLHRLEVAQPEKPLKVSRDVFKKLYQVTRGNPRLINLICDRALMAAYVEETHLINKQHLVTAAEELLADGEGYKNGYLTSSRAIRRLRSLINSSCLRDRLSNPGWLLRALAAALVVLFLGAGLGWVINQMQTILSSDAPVISTSEVEEGIVSKTEEEEKEKKEKEEEPLPNPLKIEPVEADQLPGDRGKFLSLSRLISAYSDQKVDEQNIDSDNYIKEAEFEEYFPEILTSTPTYLKLSADNLSEVDIPLLGLWGEEKSRYVLITPGADDRAWDPIYGWTDLNGDTADKKWQKEIIVFPDELIVDPETTYSIWMETEEIKEIQELLNLVGDYDLPGTEFFGPQTENSVVDFQNEVGLEPSGEIDQETLALLLSESGRGEPDWTGEEIKSFIRRLSDRDVTD